MREMRGRRGERRGQTHLDVLYLVLVEGGATGGRVRAARAEHGVGMPISCEDQGYLYLYT